MKKHLIIGVICLLLTACIGSGENSDPETQKEGYLPHLTGIDLLGEERKIPQTFAGELNIIAIGFEREHQKPINTWIPIADTIIKESPDVRFYEVPIIYKTNALYRGWINNGMRAGIPDKGARERTITVYTDRDKFTKALNMEMSTIYVLLVDKDGKILWRVKGKATSTKIKSLKEAINGAQKKSSAL